MTRTVNELLPYMLIIVSMISCWRFLGGSLRSSSRSIRSSFRDENQSWTCRIGTVLAGWLDAYSKERTVGLLWNTRFPERDGGACGPIATHRLRADGGLDSARPEGDAKKQILLKLVQRVNAQEPTELANTPEISAEVSRLPTKGELVVFTPVTAEQRDGVVCDMRNGETLVVKTSGHGDSPAADYAKPVRSKVVRSLKGAGDMSILPKIFFAMAFVCIPQRANAQQLTGNGNAVDPAASLTSDTAKVLAFVTALFAGGLGAAFIWKRFFCSPPTFSVDAGLKASPAEIGRCRSDLDSIYPRLDDCY